MTASNADLSRIWRERNRLNRVALWLGIIMCVGLFVSGAMSFFERDFSVWRMLVMIAPAGIAFNLGRLLRLYSEKKNG